MTFEPIKIHCFKAYDVRGKLGESLDETIAYRIGRAFGEYLNPQADPTKKIIIGADIRPSSAPLKSALASGILDSGTSVLDLGMTGTEEIYFATSFYDGIGGIEVTASHNPIEYNGLKLVQSGSRPISADTGLKDIQKLAEQGRFKAVAKGQYHKNSDKSAYIDHLMSYIDTKNLRPMKIVVNCGNGSAAPVIDLIEQKMQAVAAPIEFIKIHHPPDGTFPNGIPNPMLVANRSATIQAVEDHSADLAIAFDGDFDRCFFFDETGRFIEGAYVVGLLAQAFLSKDKGASIVYDPRSLYNTEHIIAKMGGVGAISKSGHSFIKEVMRQTGAVYGGEMSAHHYFKAFYYCDSGMIAWLMIIALMSKRKLPLSQLVAEMIERYPISGELNFHITGSASALLSALETNLDAFDQTAPSINKLDGLSVDYGQWRFNIRGSNTEPLVRLNVESRGDKALLEDKTDALCRWIVSQGGTPADS